MAKYNSDSTIARSAVNVHCQLTKSSKEDIICKYKFLTEEENYH